jgi:hypothetical protein
MFFIILLAITVVFLAGAAEFFSVYGLANTFSGVFWSVVIMGAALGAGKLMGVSFLYRYWNKTGLALKTYLITGIAALMILTSLGIFGFLSSGYQQDVLPLKQKNEQISLLENEKGRALTRKRQIDDLLAGGPVVGSLNKKDGTIDNNATRALRETTRSRELLVRQYKLEQADVTKRIGELDKELLTLKQEVIKTEAHIGPITYIAKAFDLDTDNATKYLILVIIFAFDPMAVALTLALNMAIRLRQEEIDATKLPTSLPFTPPQPMPPAPAPAPEPQIPVQVEKHAVEDTRGHVDFDYSEDPSPAVQKDAIEHARGNVDFDYADTAQVPVDKQGIDEARGNVDYDIDLSPITPPYVRKHEVEDPRGTIDVDYDGSHDTPAKQGIDEARGNVDYDFDIVLPEDFQKQGIDEARGSLDQFEYDPDMPSSVLPEPEPETPPAEDPAITARRFRPYPGAHWTGDGTVLPDKMRELINHHKFLKAKQDNGDNLSREEAWELGAIEDILRKNGIDMYL